MNEIMTFINEKKTGITEIFNDNKKTFAFFLLVLSFALVIWGFSGSILKIVACVGGWFLGKWCIETIWPDDEDDE